MPRRHMYMTGADGAALRAALRELRTTLHVPGEFPAEVLAEAERAARDPRLPDADATDIPLFTIDPPTSVDLDQAMHLARRPAGGFRVHYAIADVAAFVTPGGALDAEAHRRATTLYFPDGKVPLHPAALSEDAASLLPDRTRPALLWRLDLDAEGRVETTDLRRALVRSRARLDYDGVQKAIDTGTAEEPLALLAGIGRLREALEVERGGISLNVPEQEIVECDGSYSLVYRAPRPADGWNAQISLMTGIAAADLMLAAGTGILRTLPTAPDGAVGRLRRSARALRIDWPHHVPYAGLVRSLDPHLPAHAAFLQECTSLLRGAGYTPFSPGVSPDPAIHAAVAAPYAHCTAPLRRLVDRYAGELCVAAVAGVEPPQWAVAALDALPAEMAAGTRLANTAEREAVDLVEAAVLKDRVGEVFEATVIDVREREPLVGTVQLEEPAVVGRVESASRELPLGDRIRVRLAQAAPGTAKVVFALA
ncbi:ribonuclease II [Streptomyces sp. CB00455]|uniref:RNB domain-containing ribonuclease n=1 Tax=Streptomyces sp. CB00455 TaxID=1703927 RepID=UPI00093B2130|nr:RNB domain-containing ribonuclease [Streptomyces sp. CB00455]OKK19357.1 ribonuclease II [Streptomyces sp. CB00455]